MALTVATLETLFTANVKDFEKKADKVEVTTKALAKSDPTVKVGADTSKALAGMDRVQDSARRVDATTATVKVDADTSSAKSDLGSLGNEGHKAGKDAGEGLSAGILGALIALPVAGAVVGIGAAIGKSLMDGLQVEVRSDRLMAQTGLDPATTATIARVSGEAYANNFGESLASNMDTARTAIQSGLLDPKRAAEDSQAIIESLSGVADILGEEIPRVSRSTAQLLRTGLAKDAQGAFDLLVKGTQAGINVSEDMLDTVDEYSTQFRKLGLSGPMAFGLLAQAVKGGARDTDTAADALKEFAIRAVDGSKTTIDGFKSIGLSSKKMATEFTAGGTRSEKALGLTLDKLRAMKDPVAQGVAGVELFGTKWEDMGTALLMMDTSTAVQQLGNVEGAAKSAIDTLGDNAAGQIESAKRNITVAADGIKGALATAFNPQIQGAATFVTENRAAVMKFLLDLANAGLDAGRSLANGAASAVEGFGSMIGTVGPIILDITDLALKAAAAVAFMADPTGILGLRDVADKANESFQAMRPDAEAGFKAVESGSKTAAEAIRTKLIKEGLDPAQARLNKVGIPLVAQARMHDMALKLAREIDLVKQGKVPSIDIHTAAGRAKLAEMERELASMKDKTIAVTILSTLSSAPPAGVRHAPKVTPASGGYISGPGSGTSDSIPAMISNGEYVVRASSVAKFGRANLDRINSYAAGGMVGDEQGFATGGFVAADWSAIGSKLPANAPTGVDITAMRLRQAQATATLHAAEAALQKLRVTKGHTTAQVNAAEDKLANTRGTLRAVTASLKAAEASRSLAAAPLSSKVHAAASQANRATGAFIANIDTLRKRGFTVLADQLLMAPDDQAYALAAQAVKSSKVARTLTGDVSASVARSNALTLRQDALTAALQSKADAAATAAEKITAALQAQADAVAAAAEAVVAAATAARARAATLGDYTAAEAGGVANTEKFYANLTTLADRGFSALAARLLDQSDENAEIVAEQAVAASDQVVSGLNSSITTAKLQVSARQSLADRFAGVAPAGGTWAAPDKSGVAYGSAPTDMSGVRADNAEQIQVLRSLIPGFTAALAANARTIQTMQRQMAGAR